MVTSPRPIIRAAQRAALVSVLLMLPAAGARADDAKTGTSAQACPQFGAGFMRLPGSDTCIQMGGAMQFSAGRSNAISNAPNQGPQVMPSSSGTSSIQPVVDPWKQAR